MRVDLQMAREFQCAFLSQKYPAFPHDASAKESALQFCCSYRPSGTLGGDFYDILSLSETETGVFICDVMGHGVRAALVTGIIRGLVEELKPVGRDPGKFITEINRSLGGVLRQTDTTMFASAFYLTLDAATGRMRYINAGHPSPLVLQRGAENVSAFTWNGSGYGPVLGLFEDTVYQPQERQLAAGDAVLLYTDGLFEVPGVDGEEYGQDRLAAAVRCRLHMPFDRLIPEVVGEVEAFGGSKDFEDDVCLVGVDLARLLK